MAALTITTAAPLVIEGEVNRPSFDYSIVNAETADLIKRAADAVRQRNKTITRSILNTGTDLLGVKDRLGHGNFGRWLEAEFGWTIRTAQNYMQAAEALQGKSETVSYLPAATIYALSAPSTPAPLREEIVDRFEKGERLSADAIRNRLVEAQAEKRQAAADAKFSPATQKRRKANREKEKQEQEQNQKKWEAERVRQAAALQNAVGLLIAKLTPADLAQFVDYLAASERHYPSDLVRLLREASHGIVESAPARRERAKP